MSQHQTRQNPILITGANSLLARAIIGAHPGGRVYAVDTHFDGPIDGVAQIAGDLRDSDLLADISAEITDIVHLAPLFTSLGSDQETLSHTVQGTYQLATAAAKRGIRRFVMGGSSDLYGTRWARYRIDESWRPQPPPVPTQLFPYLAEMTLREVARVTGLPTLCLRLGHVVDTEMAAAMPYDPRWLHVNDAVAAVQQALTAEHNGWKVYHIGAKGTRAAIASTRAAQELEYRPQIDFQDRWPGIAIRPPASTVEPVAPRAIRNVVVFGAGGPLGTVVAAELGDDYEVLLTDVQPLDVLRAATPQSPGAPLPVEPLPTHRWQVVDVCDGAQVLAACAGADAIINCSVVRYGTDASFNVNMVGAYNVMAAAVAHGIHRVVHTGPFMLGDRSPFGYAWDYGIVDDVPPRPGIDWVYIPSKYAGQEICRSFADHHGLSVPALAFCQFVSTAIEPSRAVSPLAVSWEDAARAVRAALEVESLPHAYEFFHIGVDLPHDAFSTEKARRLLNWQARDRLEAFYLREDAQS